MKKEDVKKAVKEAYGNVAKGSGGCCGDTGGDCAPSATNTGVADFAKAIGYSEADLDGIPEGANLGLSCGNPTAISELKEGETVLDLGSGAGFDVFIAAKKVGPTGRVIGVDMTPEMLVKAKENAAKSGIENVEFRYGEIEELPVDDASVDVVISNCVINLSTEKARVFADIKRVLKPGGRIAVSDMALLKDLPEDILNHSDAYVGCVSGAVHVDEYKKLIEDAGFRDISVSVTGSSNCGEYDNTDPISKAVSDAVGDGHSIAEYVVSINASAYK
ncbi:MAG: arsenite methyltransferase [Thermodesulfobacteriota bacterium]